MASRELLESVSIVNRVGGGSLFCKAQASDDISVVQKRTLGHLIRDEDQSIEFV